MADFEAIKISKLPPSGKVLKNDLLVVDRQRLGDNYVTNAVTILSVAEEIATLDLNFTGNVTFINTIQPPLDGSLDAIFDNLTIRQSITIEDGVEINGLYLNDLEDVDITNPKENDILIYETNASTGDSSFVNKPGIVEAPDDGKIYARSNGAWIDITDCLRCPTFEIGEVVILKIDDSLLTVGTPHTYRATTPRLDPTITDLTYLWTSNNAGATITNPTGQTTNIIYDSKGTYTITCEVSSSTANDSPQYGIKSVYVENETYRLLSEPSGIYILTEANEIVAFDPPRN